MIFDQKSHTFVQAVFASSGIDFFSLSVRSDSNLSLCVLRARSLERKRKREKEGERRERGGRGGEREREKDAEGIVNHDDVARRISPRREKG